MIRLAFVLIFAVLIVTLAVCGIASYRSKKPIGRAVSFICISLIPPVLGNMIIVGTHVRTFALIGCYTYYIGMDIIMFALIRFTYEYCSVVNSHIRKTLLKVIYILLCLDVVQMLLNPFFGHAFSLQEIEAYGEPYFQMIPLLGQTYHRMVCYGALAVVMLIFIVTCLKVPNIYRERYTVILVSLFIGTLWQTFYIFSRTPIDRSMIGFAVFGLLIFHFSIYYRPLRLLDNMLADIVSDMREAVFLFGHEGKCIWVNDPAQAFTGIEENDYERAGEILEEKFSEAKSLPEDTDTEFITGMGDSAEYYILTRGMFNDSKGRKIGTYVRVRDITSEKRRMELEIFETNHDSLTGVYTKEYAIKKISERLARHELKDYYLASISICNFKLFNDVFGRDFGDYALTQVAEWMQRYSDDRCIYGRMSGDTFGSCLPKEMLIPEILEEDLSSFKVKKGNIEHHLIINIGLYEIEEEDADVSVMFDRAFLAVDSIKDNYKKHVALFDKQLRDKILWNQELSSELNKAIEEDQIFPYLQPIVDRDGRIVGAEALVRWIHPEHGFMSPAVFIPVFEENGMIVDLDKHIWQYACKILSGWKETHPELFISVNVSPKDFYLTDVLADIRGLVREYDVSPGNLRIEVTETSMMNNTDEKIQVLDDFRKLGFIVEMDDFGSGYSSLNMLKDMPVDILKIDMKFLGKSSDEEKASVIVKNVIKLIEELGIISLTEGVETKEQFEMLSGFGCMLFQGYHFSKPVPQSDFEKLIRPVSV